MQRCAGDAFASVLRSLQSSFVSVPSSFVPARVRRIRIMVKFRIAPTPPIDSLAP